MNLAEALEAVAEGKRVRSDTISKGWVVKEIKLGWDEPKLMVVHEATGSSFSFDPTKPEHEEADWQLVEGWA